ncbi:hypothetical protein, partial [Leptolyngbya sp. FACHB-711]|uniref:hypothetical protein n=1 Tax=Leptolyngbya sp. FACHB-711 TaxID=2692813 RepID=UPI0016856C56
IINKCQSRGDRIINCETIVNSFILSNLVRKIEAIPPQRVDINLLYSLVKDIRLTDAFIQRYIEFSDRNFNRKLIFRTWSLTVYVISWKPGQESRMHHHGFALDAIRVVYGKMTHWLISPDEFDGYVPFEACRESDRKRYEGPSQTFVSGDIVMINSCQGHQIANLSNEDLVTLHYRFGLPPEDDNWRSTNDAEMFIWNQAEGCFDFILPSEGGWASIHR